MAKKRRRPTKVKQQVLQTAPAPRMKEQSGPPPVAPLKPKRRLRLLAFVAALVVITGLGIAALKLYPTKERTSTEPGTSPQQVDQKQLLASLANDPFPATEKQVVEKIRGLVKEVEMNPGSAFAWGNLGMNLQIHDFQNKAIPCYRKASQLNPDDFRWHYYLAMILHETGDEEALKSYKRAIEIKPGFAPAHYRYGKALFEKKQMESAKAELRKALDADPQMIAAYVELARIAMAQNQLKESFDLITQSIRLNPNYGEAHALLSQILRRSGRHEEAARQTKIAQQLTKKIPVPDEAMQDLAMEGVSSYWFELRARSYLEQGRYEEAVQDLKLAIQASKESRFFDTLGIAYQFLGRYKEAVEQHKQAVMLSPDSANLLNNLASAHLGLGNLKEAVAAGDAAIRAEPDKPATYLHLARIHVSKNQTAAAVQVLERGHSRIPGDRTIGLQLAWLRATTSNNSLRDGKEAVRLAQSYCSANEPADLECLVVLAACYAELENFENAINLAEQAQKMAENSAPKETLTRIHQQLNRYRSRQPLRE